jgi:hypothetical protein
MKVVLFILSACSLIVGACTVGDPPNPPQPDSTERALVTAGETQVTNDWDVYSPSAIYQGGQLALYYGGWGLEQLNAFDNGAFPT